MGEYRKTDICFKYVTTDVLDNRERDFPNKFEFKYRDDLPWLEIGKISYDELAPYPANRVGLQRFPSSTFPTSDIFVSH